MCGACTGRQGYRKNGSGAHMNAVQGLPRNLRLMCVSPLSSPPSRPPPSHATRRMCASALQSGERAAHARDLRCCASLCLAAPPLPCLRPDVLCAQLAGCPGRMPWPDGLGGWRHHGMPGRTRHTCISCCWHTCISWCSAPCRVGRSAGGARARGQVRSRIPELRLEPHGQRPCPPPRPRLRCAG